VEGIRIWQNSPEIIDWDAAHFITASLFADAQISIGGRYPNPNRLHTLAMKNDCVESFDHNVSMQYYDMLFRLFER
jgi:hypothetical protein